MANRAPKIKRYSQKRQGNSIQSLHFKMFVSSKNTNFFIWSFQSRHLVNWNDYARMLFSEKRIGLLWLLKIYSEDERHPIKHLLAEEEIFVVVDEFDWKNVRVIRLIEDKLFWSLWEDKKDTEWDDQIVEHDIKLKFYERVYSFLYVIILILLHLGCY
jgi:hypothetical protein